MRDTEEMQNVRQEPALKLEIYYFPKKKCFYLFIYLFSF